MLNFRNPVTDRNVYDLVQSSNVLSIPLYSGLSGKNWQKQGRITKSQPKLKDRNQKMKTRFFHVRHQTKRVSSKHALLIIVFVINFFYKKKESKTKINLLN